MCGIVGIINTNAKSLIVPMNNQIKHRGPDKSETYTFDNLGLGHQRLSILDLAPTGDQPMFSHDKRYVIIFNGEIYNHLEIREPIKNKYPFKSSGDTETILYAFIEYGVALFSKLNGIFAFSIFDHETKELIVVRDHFGIKPLYYYLKKDVFMFGSEIKSFLPYPAFEKTLDYEALVNYIHFLWSPGEKTPFKEVKKLLGGHYMSINIDKPETFKITKYYEIPFEGKYSNKSEKELIGELEIKLTKAVERQMLSDVPLGFFLSGGLDSSIIVAIARKLKPQEPIRCYTIDTSEKGNTSEEGFTDDLPYAKKVADYLKVDLDIIKVTPDIINKFDQMIYHLDEPQADPAPINVLYICEKARKDGYKVLLGGTAGDDLFSGYRRHQYLYYERFFNKIPRFLLKGASKLFSILNSNNPLIRRARKFTAGFGLSPIDRRVKLYEWLPLDANKKLFSKKIQSNIANYNPAQYLIDSLQNIPNEKEALNHLLFWDLKYFLTDHNLNYTDKMSMAYGIEVRVPFLDTELVEFSTQIPVHLKMKGLTTKYLLRKVAERYLPNDVIYRPKSGFGAPVRKWITGELSEKIEKQLSRENIEKTGIFDYEQVQTLIKNNKEGKVDASYSVWSVLAIQSWMELFI